MPSRPSPIPPWTAEGGAARRTTSTTRDINRNDPADASGRRQDRNRHQRRSARQKRRFPQHRQRGSSAPGILLAVNSTDYKLTMKPTESLKLKHDTMTQTMATIERKINGLGLAESSVQPTGRSDAEAELLVQLPGVDDSAHVKQLLQTQAVLEWDEVKDGPFSSREEALSKHGGILPLEYETGSHACTRRPAELVSGVAHPGGARHRYSRRPRRARRGGPLGDEFRAHPGRRQAIRPLHRGQYRQPRGHRGGWPGDQRAHHPEPNQRHRPDYRGSDARKKRPIWR